MNKIFLRLVTPTLQFLTTTAVSPLHTVKYYHVSNDKDSFQDKCTRSSSKQSIPPCSSPPFLQDHRHFIALFNDSSHPVPPITASLPCVSSITRPPAPTARSIQALLHHNSSSYRLFTQHTITRYPSAASANPRLTCYLSLSSGSTSLSHQENILPAKFKSDNHPIPKQPQHLPEPTPHSKSPKPNPLIS
ncbi:hypothetical protein F5Y15DRAFT_233181 [Xylariaceae sp. FL0016]|nr:hypothetical protein F5Y15DRAFT_233181 [Xylariaceae sp. FL0016]